MKKLKFILTIVACYLGIVAFGLIAPASATDLNPKVLKLAEHAYNTAQSQGIKDPKHLLTVVDYSLPSNKPRLWVLDMAHHHKVLYHTLVAHGQGSGSLMAKHFSNNSHTHASSLGLYLTEGAYTGHLGYALRLKGLEKGFNNNAERRSIVMHGAWYVSKTFARHYGRLGRSWGCLALNKKVSTPLIKTIKDGTLIFAYYPDANWLRHSTFL